VTGRADRLPPIRCAADGRTVVESPAPDTRLSLKQLAADFVPWRPGRSNGMSGRYVIVMPFPDARPLPGSGHALD